MDARVLVSAAVAAVLVAACRAAEPPEARTAPPDPELSVSPEATPTPLEVARRAQPRNRVNLPPARWVVGRDDGVVLAFVGSPSPRLLAKALRALSRADASAVFFLRGKWAASHESAAASIPAAGYALGNAGWGPRVPRATSELRRSLFRTERVLLAAGADPRPYLSLGGPPRVSALKVAGSLGYQSVRPTLFPKAGRSQAVADELMPGIRPGTIIALDPGDRGHVRALPALLKRLREISLEPLRVASLLDVPAVRWDLSLVPGSAGPQVRYMQQRLADASYLPGAHDGRFGPMTLHAVYAFEKVHGLERDGVVDPAQLEAIVASPPPPVPDQPGGTFVDVDVTRQVLFEVSAGRLVATIPVSTANGANYTYKGNTYTSVTPRGEFVVERKIPDWRISHLGGLFYPSYFHAGYAIHGSESVPPYPASHGCIRIPMHVAVDFYSRNPIGTPVYVHD